MNPFQLSVAFGPVAIYFVLLAMINGGRRPLLVSGVRDTATLGLAVAGMVFVGPVQLFFPMSAAVIGSRILVWFFLISLYVLCLLLILMMSRPRLIVYNMAADRLRPVLANLAVRLDPEARWAGDCLALPSLGIQFYMDHAQRLRNVSLVATGVEQNYQSWRRFEVELQKELGQTEVPRNPSWVAFAVAGSLMVLVLATSVLTGSMPIDQALGEMFQL